MQIQNRKEFIFECREFLSAQSLASLRSYGRTVGVESPTSRKKGELIEEIIGILVEDIPAKERSGRGAPVLDNRTDFHILDEIARLKQKYAQNEGEEKQEEEIAKVPTLDWDFQKRLEKMRKRARMISFSSSEFVVGKEGNSSSVRGQLAQDNGLYFLLPLDFIRDEDKMLVPDEFVEFYALKEGDVLGCASMREGKTPVVTKILEINGQEAIVFRRTTNFDDMEVCYPTGKITTYDWDKSPSIIAKYMDWIVPFSKGSRALITAPPKTGKTCFLEKVAAGAFKLNEDVKTLVLLLDQSPETVGQFRKVIDKDCLVYATYEEEPERQLFLAKYLLQRAKRLAECGQNILLIVDSFNALAHAYNESEESSGGKMLPCGLESKTIHFMKKYLGAARCFTEGGSLTILGAVSNLTGNPADDVLKAELSSIANLEIRLKEELALKRVFPAVDMDSLYIKYNESSNEEQSEILALLRQARVANLTAEEMISALGKIYDRNKFVEFLQKF